MSAPGAGNPVAAEQDTVPLKQRHSLSVLHILNRLSDRGDGISNVCVDLACQQAIDGDQVAIATLPGGYTELVERFGVQLIEFDFRLRTVRGLSASSARSLRRVIRRLDPDIVHVTPCSPPCSAGWPSSARTHGWSPLCTTSISAVSS